ncbi:MAG: hypothetical protein ACLGSD_15845 [Acidobacteriota bacterium]
MHFHFSSELLEQVLWTVTFAAHLVLLVVLLGRDRAARFPWFTASIALVAFRLLTSRLLFGRLPQMTMAKMFIVIAAIGGFISLLVVLELARRAFGRVRRNTWVISAVAVMAVGALVLVFWGPWPAWKTVVNGPSINVLQVIAQKTSLLADVETIVVGLLIVAFGRRYGAGWRSHTQSIAIGLSTASIAQLSIQGIWQFIARSAVAHSMAEYQRILGIREHLFNTSSGVYVVVLIWWIIMLWYDEPGAQSKIAPVGPSQPEAESTGSAQGV